MAEEKQGTDFTNLGSASTEATESIVLNGIEQSKATSSEQKAPGTDFTKLHIEKKEEPAGAAPADNTQQKSAEDQAKEDLEKYPGKSAEEITALKTQEAETKKIADEAIAAKNTEISAAQKTYDDALKTAATDEEKQIIKDKFEADKTAIENKYKPEEKIPSEFQVPGTESSNNEEANGWTDLAKEQGFEIKEDTPEAYKQGVEDYYRSKYEPELGKFHPEAQQLIEYLNADPSHTIESFMKPFGKIDQLLELSSVELVTENLRAEKMPEDLIIKEIEDLTEKGMLEKEDFKIRKALEKTKQKIKDKIVENAKIAQERSANYNTVTEAKRIEGIKKTLVAQTEFMGIPITNEVRQYINSKLEKGDYAQKINDPALTVKGILFDELGKQVIDIITAKATAPLKEEAKKKLHNIPTDQSKAPGAGSGGRSSSNTGGEQAEGNFKQLKNFSEKFSGEVIFER